MTVEESIQHLFREYGYFVVDGSMQVLNALTCTWVALVTQPHVDDKEVMLLVSFGKPTYKLDKQYLLTLAAWSAVHSPNQKGRIDERSSSSVEQR